MRRHSVVAARGQATVRSDSVDWASARHGRRRNAVVAAC